MILELRSVDGDFLRVFGVQLLHESLLLLFYQGK